MTQQSQNTATPQLALKAVPMNQTQNVLAHSRLGKTIEGVEKDLAKKVMQEENYRYIPKELLGEM